ncbi:cobyrinic acid A,C-diamide synthase [Oxobacter pfennigii]|uniref:Cobyrinic acid A,C-diamide synthase n=1 Tax=Oxobacter pfennigii TaxID=36849 RepID=A0A0P8WCE8_9CLOT|nr:cobyrinate a,c-diamide synthase [Oxobacter pfennigii]KPU45403.1 cobyrinic acid A,C-diamide synthase [Oxobacter pfennigii]
MKGIMITSPSSGSGKTTFTMGLLRALKMKGLDICGFKTGPDYIDTAFIKEACGKDGTNLDMHLQGRDGMKKALSLGNAEYCIIEGAMGYFDGMHNNYINSSYDISRELDVNAVLIYTPQAEMFTAVPKIKGMAEFGQSKIKAVIINRVEKNYYALLKEAIEEHTDLKVLGHIPPLKEAQLKSRHLGLVQSMEIEDLKDRIENVAQTILENVDVEALINLMKEIKGQNIDWPRRRNIKAAVAKDKAFSFYYRENIELLKNCCEVEFFSPMNDDVLPECDLLYLGGGYPEVFKEELSKNTSMLKSIKGFAEKGGCIFGECGGFMYLLEYIEDCKMAGVFKGKSYLTKSLQRFGYMNTTLKVDCLLGDAGDKLTGHEFHKSTAEVEGDTVYEIRKAMGEKVWSCGYKYKNVLGGYPHISFLGNMKALNHMLDYVERNK